MKSRSKTPFSDSLYGLFVWMFAFFCTGCSDPVTKHSINNFFFDGVPPLPTLDRLCEPKLNDLFTGYYNDRIKETMAGSEAGESKVKSGGGSIHPPFAQRNCGGCHDFQKSNLLLLPPDQLCFKCHKNFIKGVNVHGPVAVGACLACHFPHDSINTSLLRQERTTICSRCHQEGRLAANMHYKVVEHKMACVDCHDPHSGNAHYFLK